jgi:hypothetical protein
MREITLKKFFEDQISAEVLAADVAGSVEHLDSIAKKVRVEDSCAA